MKAYLTLLSTSDYLPGVLCMKKSLDDTETPFPLYVGLSHSLPASIEWILVKHGVRPIRLPAHAVVSRSKDQGGHYWANTFDKLHLFGLTQFSKFVYIDCDMMVMSNIDELFEQPHMSAVAAGKLVHPDYVRLNSGLMVVEPQEGLPERIGARLQVALDEAAADRRMNLGDQDLINAYYPEWSDSDLQLDDGYNVFHSHVDAYVESGQYALPGSAQVQNGRAREIKVLHFIGPLKPWTVKGMARNLFNLRHRNEAPVQRYVFFRYCRLLARLFALARPRPQRSPASVERQP